MPLLDLVDQVYVAVPAADLRPALCDERAWQRWLPDLRLVCHDDRGDLGKRWTVSGALVGTAEVWLEELPEGTVVHAFLRAGPVGGGGGGVSARALRRAYEEPLRRYLRVVRDAADPGRPAGVVPAHVRRAGRTGDRVEPAPRAPAEEAPDGQPDHE